MAFASLFTVLRRPKLSLTGDWVNFRRGVWKQASPDTDVTFWSSPDPGRNMSSLQSNVSHLSSLFCKLVCPTFGRLGPPGPSSRGATEPTLATSWCAGEWGIPWPSRRQRPGVPRRSRLLHAVARSAGPTLSLIDAIGPLELVGQASELRNSASDSFPRRVKSRLHPANC